jgi:hypothetical protein
VQELQRLLFPAAGNRNNDNGNANNRGNNANNLNFNSGNVNTNSNNRAYGQSVRCVQNLQLCLLKSYIMTLAEKLQERSPSAN